MISILTLYHIKKSTQGLSTSWFKKKLDQIALLPVTAFVLECCQLHNMWSQSYNYVPFISYEIFCLIVLKERMDPCLISSSL